MLFERPPLTILLRGVALFRLLSVISASSQSPHSTSHDSRSSQNVYCVPLCSVAQSCLTPCDPMDCSLPGFSVDGILQARILELVGMHFSRGSSPSKDRTHISHSVTLKSLNFPKSLLQVLVRALDGLLYSFTRAVLPQASAGL